MCIQADPCMWAPHARQAKLATTRCPSDVPCLRSVKSYKSHKFMGTHRSHTLVHSRH